MWDFMSCESKPMSIRPLPYSFHDVELTSIDGVCTLANVVIANPLELI
jgi:hypothetical protein